MPTSWLAPANTITLIHVASATDRPFCTPTVPNSRPNGSEGSTTGMLRRIPSTKSASRPGLSWVLSAAVIWHSSLKGDALGQRRCPVTSIRLSQARSRLSREHEPLVLVDDLDAELARLLELGARAGAGDD